MGERGQRLQPGKIFDVDLHHQYLFYRRTKIVATIGPASSSPKVLSGLISRGLDVARINFSHGEPEAHLRTIKTIRTIAGRLGRNVAVLGDLCGPKIRTGKFRNGSAELKKNSSVLLTAAPVLGDATTIPCQYRGLIEELSAGDSILLDDGNLELLVTGTSAGRAEAKVVRGGILRDNKGMNLPDTRLKIPALTPKDRRDVLYCIKGGVDYLALSFVRRPEDVRKLRTLLRRHRADIPVIAKIEKPEALDNVEDILAVADGIMIARGDLGVELPVKKVPMIQRKLIDLASQHNRPVIVATQMLESMIENSRPTRAEVSDISAACVEGADAVMLSAETASGRYPLESIAMMDSILRETEAYQFFARGGLFKEIARREHSQRQNAISTAIAQLSRDLMVRCIVVSTKSGYTAGNISADRPAAPVIALTSSEKVFRRLQLIWGVVPHLLKKSLHSGDSLLYAESLMKSMKLACSGDFILMLFREGMRKTKTNSIVIHQIS